ncbi:cupin domain-containing protein [Pontibacillus litoralis]|uniref:Cupin n=1 Tax=Pontibacillus litoralis JSM 072002 TaxID=1385512 RepID=A0A0A5FVF0_9BACI|nr:cupin domain-containing protein [Pontibacillus litoralis]KGX84781.1 cupin [Pontibacillus litoralis JSM 072002]
MHYVYPYEHSGSFQQQVLDSILDCIKSAATAVRFYYQLADEASSQQHKNELKQLVRSEEAHLQYFTDLYRAYTGQEPNYEVGDVSFSTYEEGIQMATEWASNVAGAFRQGYLKSPYSPFRDVFLRVSSDKMEHAKRLKGMQKRSETKDYGGQPFVVNIERATKKNNTFRTALWTGEHLQVTLMSIQPGEDIGLEIHPNVDQFLRIEDGKGFVQMGDKQDSLTFERNVFDDDAIMIPAGTWHNVTNTGNDPLKLYSIYAPPEHPFGTVHETKADAMEAEY